MSAVLGCSTRQKRTLGAVIHVVVILLSSVNSSANFMPRRGSPRGSPSLGPSCKLTIALTCGHSFINALRAPHTPTIFLGSMLAIDVAANHTDGGRL